MKSFPVWLKEIGLERYEPGFARNGIDFDVIADLSDQELQELGLNLGDRKRLRQAITELDKGIGPQTALSDSAPAAHPIDKRATPEGERRQLTVMFCDLVDSTALSARLDPEQLRDVVRAYQSACAQIVERFEGHIAQYLGDGILVYFGHPQAHEDDAQRAVRAGLGIVAAMRDLNRQLAEPLGVPLAVRVGIHTGLVVVGEMGAGQHHEQLPLGETPNVAARIQALATPDTVAVSAATESLVHGLFTTHDLGAREMKGVPGLVKIFCVQGETEARTRLEAAGAGALTPLVGRSEEVGLLLGRWEQVLDGQGQVLVLIGEPGIGKSRLVQVAKERVADTPHTWLECRGSPYYQHSPLYPIVDLLPRALGWTRDDTDEAKLEKLDALLTGRGLSTSENVGLMAALLSLPAQEGNALPPMSPARQKRRTLETLLAWFMAMTAEQPVLIVVEDLHWADPTTQEFLTLLIDQAATSRLLLLMTTRPTFTSPWRARSHLTEHTINRISRRQTEQMAARVAGDKTLPLEVLEQIVAKTDGVPLFVEELTKMVLESGLLKEATDRYELTGPLPPLAIPSTLQDSLMARLDRLAAVKEVAQLGATLGRAFTYALLEEVSTLDPAALQRELARLVEAELLYQRGLPPQATYIFKHALIQEAAYQSLLKSTRQQYHQRIAKVMLERFAEDADTRPEYVAHHFTEAGLGLEAAQWWQKAGQRAFGRAANAEAIGHCRRGLEALSGMAPSGDRDRSELGLQMALGNALLQVKGWSAAESAEPFVRAGELCRAIGETPETFRVQFASWAFSYVQGDQHRAREFAEQCLTLAKQADDVDLLINAHSAMGHVKFCMGELADARANVERSVALYGADRREYLTVRFGRDPKVSALQALGWTLWALGYPDQSLARARENFEFAMGTSHPFMQIWGHCALGAIYVLRREPEGVDGPLAAGLALAIEQAFPFWVGWITCLRGGELIQSGQTEQGIALTRNGIDVLSNSGSRYLVPFWLSILAQAYRSVGDIEKGLAAVARGLALADQDGQHFSDAELRREKGELLLLQTPRNSHEAEASFATALKIARSQGAKSFELRAAMSLARLRQRQDRHAEARELLSAIYDWFIEGFDTPDLKEARKLLEELS